MNIYEITFPVGSAIVADTDGARAKGQLALVLFQEYGLDVDEREMTATLRNVGLPRVLDLKMRNREGRV